jgi:hypothetical protein
MQIVKVKYFDSISKSFNSREYSYFSVDDLKLGDLITVPIRDTTGKAMVTAINLPESSVATFKDKLKTIPTGSLIKEPTLAVDFEENPDISIEQQLTDGFRHPETVSIGNFSETPEPESKLATVTDDHAFINLKTQIEGIVKYAQSRQVTNPEELTGASNDLIIMRQLEKSVDQLRRQWVDPLNAQVTAINGTFKELSVPLLEADNLTGGLITKYKADVDAARRHAEELNREADELARKQAAANNGVFTVDTTPVMAPASVAKTVRVEAGSVGTRKTRKARVVDFAKLPDMYKITNQRLLDTAAKTSDQPIPGVEFYFDESLTTRSK